MSDSDESAPAESAPRRITLGRWTITLGKTATARRHTGTVVDAYWRCRSLAAVAVLRTSRGDFVVPAEMVADGGES